ncbi:MAG: hypothetical protein OXR72_12555 [Gemmatimonadota bacterium]|nr:hypothetical protein [Gemmatimonadota bacterium]
MCKLTDVIKLLINSASVQDMYGFRTGVVGVPGSEGILPSTSDDSSHTVFSANRYRV